MSTAAINIGHFARIPEHVNDAKIPERAKGIWRQLAYWSSPEQPEVWVRQQTVAEKQNCCTHTIGRGIKVLIEAGLLIATNKWHQGRHKIYALVWLSPEKILPPTYKNVEPPMTSVPKNPPQKSPNIIRVSKQNIEQFLAAPELIKNWQEKFPCLDGHSGRPTVQECIEQALNHHSQSKYKNKDTYLKMWLRNAAWRWWSSYNRELNAANSDSGLSKEALAKKLRDETYSRRLYEENRQAHQKAELARYFR